MSMESAMAVLEKAAVVPETKPGANPDAAEVVKDKAADAVKDINFNIKLDGLTTPAEKASQSEEQKPKPTEQKDESDLAPKDDKADLSPPEEKKDEKDERMSQRFAVLAKKEKDLYRSSQAIKAKEQAIAEKERAIENFEKFRAEVRQNPMMALNELGITYDELTKYVLSGKMPDGEGAAVEAVKRELEELRNQLKERQQQEEKQREELTKQELSEKVAAFQQEIRDYVSSNADRFELINLYEATPVVYQAIENHFNETGRIMSVEEGCEVVEKHYEGLVDKTLTAKKLASRLAPKQATKQTPTAQSRTLSNELTSSAPSMLPAKTEQDRLKRALAALDRAV